MRDGFSPSWPASTKGTLRIRLRGQWPRRKTNIVVARAKLLGDASPRSLNRPDTVNEKRCGKSEEDTN